MIESEELDDRKDTRDTEDDEWVRAMYPHMMEVFGKGGWDDPSMDIYNELDPRLQQPTHTASGTESPLNPIATF